MCMRIVVHPPHGEERVLSTQRELSEFIGGDVHGEHLNPDACFCCVDTQEAAARVGYSQLWELPNGEWDGVDWHWYTIAKARKVLKRASRLQSKELKEICQ